ncbi:MAG: hypothetical protein HY901_13470, partial [Deltaproteobacteria bacterium]|nr:hypothetical protein [Deltaproteobacteria bacterium]
MPAGPLAHQLLAHEARALLTRLELVKPLVLQETMLPAAAPTFAAQVAIERHLQQGRRRLRRQVLDFLAWLGGEGQQASPAEQQRRYTFLRLRFNVVLSELDIFCESMSQRSEA